MVNSINLTWFGKAHSCLHIRSHSWLCKSKNQAMRSKELSEDLRDRIVLRHKSGEGYQRMSAELKVPKNTVASIILKWKMFGTTKTLPRAGRPTKLSNHGRSTLVRERLRTLWSLWQSSRVPLWRWENLPEGQPSLQHSANQAFMVVWRPSHSVCRILSLFSCFRY